MQTRLHSFDGTEPVDGQFVRPDRYRHLFAALKSESPTIPRGSGLSYCAAAAGDDVRSVSGLCFNRILDFDPDRGRVRVEPGVRVGELYRFSTARGWVLPVTPGHPSISLGGCIGANIHGKNQLRDGCFVNVVESLDLFHPNHGELHCSRAERPDLFHLTAGGFGLTGFVTSLELRLRRCEAGGIRVHREPVGNLIDAVELAEQRSAADLLYSWHNLNRRRGFGRGFLYVGRNSSDRPQTQADRLRYADLALERRSNLPIGRLAKPMTRIATQGYEWLQRLSSPESVVSLSEATFPLIGKEMYFRLYGKAGFREYQLLVPRTEWEVFVGKFSKVVQQSRLPIGLASIKLFGGETTLLRFDGNGVCLAVDVPAVPGSLELFAALDGLALDHGCIVNLAKDSRLTAALVSRVFPQYDDFRSRLREFDPDRRFDSALRRRLGV